MASRTQSFQNHTAWQPMFHYVASPLTGLYMLYAISLAIREPSTASAIHALWAFGLAVGVFASRIMVLTVQNRIIRLEMRLRFRELLSGDLLERSKALTVRQLVALRFASDAELPALIERTLKGEFPTQKAIKAAIKDWQADWLRA
jgi:hypothetical protein